MDFVKKTDTELEGSYTITELEQIETQKDKKVVITKEQLLNSKAEIERLLNLFN